MHAHATTHTGTASKTLPREGRATEGAYRPRRGGDRRRPFHSEAKRRKTRKKRARPQISRHRVPPYDIFRPSPSPHHPPNRCTQLHTSPRFSISPASALSTCLSAVLCARPPAPSAPTERGKRPRNDRKRRKELAALPDVSHRRRRCSAVPTRSMKRNQKTQRGENVAVVKLSPSHHFLGGPLRSGTWSAADRGHARRSAPRHAGSRFVSLDARTFYASPLLPPAAQHAGASLTAHTLARKA